MKNRFTKVAQMPSKFKLDNTMSIGKTGRIGLGSDFTKKLELNIDSRAQMYWDGDTKTIALTFARDGKKTSTDRKPGAVEDYSVAFVNGDAGYVNANGFFKAVGIDPVDYVAIYKYRETTAGEAGIDDQSANAPVFFLDLTA